MIVIDEFWACQRIGQNFNSRYIDLKLTYYLSAFLFYGLAVIYLFQEGRPCRGLVFIIGMTPLVLLALLRGGVGTDTATYLGLVEEIGNYGTAGLESGFVFFVKAMLYLGIEPLLILALIGLITTVVLISASLTSERAMVVSALCIVPIFYLDMTMNGLRYGLSFALAMYSIALFSQKRVVAGSVLGVCSVLFHISGLALFVIMALLASNRLELKRWAVLSAGLALIVLAEVGFLQAQVTQQTELAQQAQINLAQKAADYAHFVSPTPLSGLAPLIFSLIVIFIIFGEGQMRKWIGLRQLYILLVLVIVTFVVAKFSYAGLRLQFLVLFAMLVALQFKPESPAAAFQAKGVKSAMAVVGILGCLAFLKNIYLAEGIGATPFLPYSVNPSLHVLLHVDR